MDSKISFCVCELHNPCNCDSECHHLLLHLLYYRLRLWFLQIFISSNVRTITTFTAYRSRISHQIQLNRLFCRFPFDWKTPFGYLVGVSIQGVSMWSVVFCVHNALCLLVGLCWIMIAFIIDIETEFKTLNKKYRHKNGQFIKYKEFRQQFYQIVQFHSDVKQLSWFEENLKWFSGIFTNFHNSIAFDYY